MLIKIHPQILFFLFCMPSLCRSGKVVVVADFCSLSLYSSSLCILLHHAFSLTLNLDNGDGGLPGAGGVGKVGDVGQRAQSFSFKTDKF